MTQYSIEPRIRKYVKGYRLLSFATEYRKQLLDTEPHPLKTASKKVVHKAAEVTGEVLRNKIADKIGKPKYVTDKNPINFEKITISLEKREEILNENKLRKVL